ncbi:MAG: DUF2085 domain-containing protein [Candidatus Thalassarchaeaceae archaeon]|nr:DUF2085 domain-containing protein [Candidatus Thalassarchaeaceae archaeon]
MASDLIGSLASLKNGLQERTREIRVCRILGGVAGGYLLLCFIAPYMLPFDTVPELSGRANALDYPYHGSWGNEGHMEGGVVGHDQSQHGGTFAWTELNPVWAVAYGLGDLNCHQKHQRSWEINGNQMPVCSRDIGILLGFAIGCAVFGFRGLNRWTVRDSFLSVFPDDWLVPIYLKDFRLMAVFAILGVGLTPMAIDGFTQLFLDSYESTNPTRVITGFVAGLVGGWWFSSVFSARPRLFDSADSVGLPANASLVIK